MNNRNIPKTLPALFFLLTTAFLNLTQTAAQGTSAEPTYIRINQVQLKPTLVERFRAFHIYQTLPSQRRAELPWRITEQSVFGNSWEMVVIQPIENFAQFDDSSISQTELRDSLFATSVDARRSYIVQARPELGIEGNEGILPVHRVARIQVKPGSIPAFEAYWAEEVIPAFRRSGIREYTLFQTVAGGGQGEYFGSLYLESFADLDGFNIVGGLTESEQAEFQAEFGAMVDEIEITIYSVDGELSFGLPNLQP